MDATRAKALLARKLAAAAEELLNAIEASGGAPPHLEKPVFNLALAVENFREMTRELERD